MRNFRLRLLFFLLTASLLLMFLDSRASLNPFRSVVQVVTAPVKYSFYTAKLGLEDFFSFVTFWRSGEARVKNLEQRNLELVAFEARVKDLEQENANLRSQLGVKPLPAGRKIVAATVLGVGQSLEILAGKMDGVAEGDAVFYLGNLVGRVVRVSNRASFVQLPTNSQAVIPVKIGRVNGLTFGQFNSAIILDRVAQNEEIKVDDLVVTSGEGESYEPGLIVGKIKKIVSLPTDLFQKAEIAPLIDYGKLMTVFIILD